MSDWTPYALERYRTSSRRLGAKGFALLGAALLLWGAFAWFLSSGETDIGLGDDSRSTLNLEPPDQRPKPVTIKIEPGRAQVLDQPLSSSPDGAGAASAQVEPTYPVVKWLLIAGSALVLPWLARRLLARPAKHEVNFGVYKGAMPLEMISATQRDLLYSRKAVEGPLFGRARTDYVPQE